MKGDRSRGVRSSRIWLTRGALVLTLLAVCGRPSAGQGGALEGTPPAPAAESPWVSEEQALATAERFARAVDLPWGEDRTHATFDTDKEGSPARWMVVVTSGGVQAAVYNVDAVGNFVSYASNRLESARQTKEVRLSPEGALARAREIVERIGVERSLIALGKLELVWDPRAGGQHWRVEWERVLDGERVGRFVTVALNAESGALIQVSTTGWTLGPADVRIDRHEAARRVLEIGAELLGAGQVELDRLPELRPVLPNDYFGPSGYEAPESSAVRTAWSVALSPRARWGGGCSVWIDPVDGRLLGGRGHAPETSARRVPYPAGPGWGRFAGGTPYPMGRNAPARSAAGRAKAAGRYLVGAIAGMAAVVIIVLVVLWPRRGGGPPSDR